MFKIISVVALGSVQANFVRFINNPDLFIYVHDTMMPGFQVSGPNPKEEFKPIISGRYRVFRIENFKGFYNFTLNNRGSINVSDAGRRDNNGIDIVQIGDAGFDKSVATTQHVTYIEDGTRLLNALDTIQTKAHRAHYEKCVLEAEINLRHETMRQEFEQHRGFIELLFKEVGIQAPPLTFEGALKITRKLASLAQNAVEMPGVNSWDLEFDETFDPDIRHD